MRQGPSPSDSSVASAEEVDDGSDGRERVALGRGKSDIECGFEFAAELDQVEGISTKVVDERRIQPQSGRGANFTRRVLRKCQWDRKSQPPDL